MATSYTKSNRAPAIANRKPRRLGRFSQSQREKLLELRDALLDSISGAANGRDFHANGGGLSAFAGDLADAGGNRTQRDLATTLISQEHTALLEIDCALRRIETGVYGICEMSGERIPRTRLQAIPFARYTVECQARLEKERKVSSPGLQLTPPLEPHSEEQEERELEFLSRGRAAGLARGVSFLEAAVELAV